MEYKKSQHSIALRMFKKAKGSGILDLKDFAHWTINARFDDWRKLHSAWCEADQPAALNWPILKEHIQLYSDSSTMGPLPVLWQFLERSQDLYHWITSQSQETCDAVYRTCEHWLQGQKSTSPQDQLILLSIARVTNSMGLWSKADNTLTEQLEWCDAMDVMNRCGALSMDYIERIPTTKMLFATMVECAECQWHHVAQCIENTNGPGMWLEYTFTGAEDFFDIRKEISKKHVRKDSLDAWALEQYDLPNATFETTFPADLDVYKSWAHQWSISCVIGPTQESSLALVRSITTQVRTDVSIDVDSSIFEML